MSNRDLSERVFDNDCRFLIVAEESGNLLMIPEDGVEELVGEFFDDLLKLPNYQTFNLEEYGTGMWILADPYCNNEITSQIKAFAKEIGIELASEKGSILYDFN